MAAFNNNSIYREFQNQTINWCGKQLLSNKTKVKRFLVADEVGLGKTMVAKGLIEKLKQKKSHPCIVYVCSSLDIINQNRYKLDSASSSDDGSPGRITLIRAYRESKRGTKVYFLTPGTSLFISNSTGLVEERLYMAWLVNKMFQIPQNRIISVFKCNASSFSNRFNGLKSRNREDQFINLNKRDLAKLKIHWKQYTGIIRHGARSEFNGIVKKMRHNLAELLLSSLAPDLIILDEFQKFKDILIPGKKDEKNICHLLVKPNVPTLLLSATPYKLLSQNTESALSDETSHYDEFYKILCFVTADPTYSKALLERIAKHGAGVKDLLEKRRLNGTNEGNSPLSIMTKELKEFQTGKEKLENELTKYMSRTERVFFQLKETGAITTKFLSKDDKVSHITKDEIKEFLLLSAHSKKSELLAYWKSGSHLVSYLQDYLLGHKLRKKKSISGKQFLYTQFKDSSPRNRKIEYVAKDINITDESCRYLWIPPLKPYYEGKGIFRNDVLKRMSIKKGLVFSSWKFVPRQIAAELSRMRDSRFRTMKKKYQIKVTPVTWCSFFHPSKVLADCLSHEDFVKGRTYERLKKIATKNIYELLNKNGIKLTKGKKSSKAWEVLRHLEYYHDQNSWRSLIRTYRKPVSRSRQNQEKKSRQLIEARYLNYLNREFDETITVNKKTIEELANIAISSPAVTIRRGMSSMIDEKALMSHSLMEELARICLIEIRSFVSRYTTIQCVKAAYKHRSYHSRIAHYFRDGNIQAVIDEFLFCMAGTLDKQNTPHDAVKDLLNKLRCVFQYRKSVLMPFKNKRTKHRVNTHLAMAFGESQQEGISRDDLRIAFNSPFWPFVLATTSIGQEGLDFHLYCKNIYHWNLPSNPVDFEQREGRLTRYNSLAIRESMLSLNIPLNDGLNGKTYWQNIFEKASGFCHYNDRYNLGLSPNWICTPENKNTQTQLVRHILDLPNSSDKRRYESLIERLRLYRLALGQPNPDNYLRKLEEENVLRGIDARSLYLNLFPFDEGSDSRRLKEILKDEHQILELVKDAELKVKELSDDSNEKAIQDLVNKSAQIIRSNINPANNSSKPSRSLKDLVAALLHFVNINDKVNDRLPVIGYKDDLNSLKQGLRNYKNDI